MLPIHRFNQWIGCDSGNLISYSTFVPAYFASEKPDSTSAI
jgi:hypothetical protein